MNINFFMYIFQVLYVKKSVELAVKWHRKELWMQIKKKIGCRERELRTFGSTSSPFANEIGIIMRNVVSQRLTGWSQADERERDATYKGLLVSTFCNKCVYILFNIVINYNFFFFALCEIKI